jgi:hypothetical protein
LLLQKPRQVKNKIRIITNKMPLDISGLKFFMPVFSFLFVFVIVYAILAKTKIIGESKFVHLLISFIISIVFMSVSSMELYVREIIPWFAVLIVIVFLVLLVAGFSTKKLEDIMTPTFAWIAIAVLIIIFLIAAIQVFNPVLHPESVVVSGDSPGIIGQLRDFVTSSKVAGSIILLIVAAIVAWIITKK